MLVLADRNFDSSQAWQQGAAAGAALLWRVSANLRPSCWGGCARHLVNSIVNNLVTGYGCGTTTAEGPMAIQRSIRLTANPRPPCPGQPAADSELVHARRDLTGAVRDIDSRIDHHLDDTRRYVEAAGLSARTIHEVVGRLGLMAPCVPPIRPTAKHCGTAVTVVLAPGGTGYRPWRRNSRSPATSSARPRVAPSAKTGLVGDLLASSVPAPGRVGQVIDGGRRDIAAVEATNLPVFRRTINSQAHVQGQSGLGNRPGWLSHRMRGRHRRAGPPTRGQ
jgi:hypothetical protein